MNNEFEWVNIESENLADIRIQFDILNEDEIERLINNSQNNAPKNKIIY